jgi:predicted ATP-dependent endonuclease of OLD family
MTHITIKNVGPIMNVELDLNKINVFMGPQSSGKSTIAKIISYCSWFEKNYILAAKPLKDFYSELLEFHNFEENYFCAKSRIEYKSANCHIVFSGKNKDKVQVTTTVDVAHVFKNAKIEYIPAERNVVAIPGIGNYNKTHNNILAFLYDWVEAKSEIKKESQFVLPIKSLDNVAYYYSKEDDTDNIIIDNGKEIKLQHSSSGLISVTPLLIVFNYIINVIYSKKGIKSANVNLRAKLDLFDDKRKKQLTKVLNEMEDNRSRVNAIKEKMEALGDSLKDSDRIRKEIEFLESTMELMQGFFNLAVGFDSDYNYSKVIIEEPELNLFPETQRDLIYYMLSVLNSDERDHQIVLTTHSPYILFSLNNCMMGGLVKDNIPEKERESFASRNAWIDPKKVSIYEIHDGSLQTIQDEDGIIEDNYLNKAYKENSAEYLSLLNYYEDEE